MLKLVACEMLPLTQQRLTRMIADVKTLERLPEGEKRAAYDAIEKMRDKLSQLLDRMDGKHV